MKALTILLGLVIASPFCFAEIINVPDDFETIQAAINESDDGDTVLVQPGEYVENIDFSGKNIVIGSLFLTTGDEELIEQTIIDGDGEGGVVTFDDGETRNAVLTGFTLLNGNRRFGGGILCQGSEPTLTHLVIRDNVAGGGGGIYCTNGTNPLIQNVVIEDNSAGIGGGIYCIEDGDFIMEDSNLEGNVADALGGGFAIRGSDPILRHVNVLRNTVRSGMGAGFLIGEESNPTLEDVTVIWNFINENGSGGGFYIHSSGGTYRNLIVSHNTSRDWGGGFHLLNSDMDLERVVIAFNFAELGGAGITPFSGTRLELSNVTMYGNITPDGWCLQSRESEVTLVNSIFWGNQPTEIRDDMGIAATYSDIEDGFNGEGNITEDPLFADPDEGNYHLTEDSPCIDAGDPESPEDPDRTRADMGAFYFNQTHALNIELNEGWNLISLNVLPTEEFYAEDEDRGPDVELMTEQLRIDNDNHHIVLMKDEQGLFYAPAWDNFNNIPYWDLTKGYWVKVDENVDAVWSGEPIASDADISLAEGWNMISYFPTYELDAGAPDFYVLSPIIDQLIIAKNESGRFISTEFNFSNMPPWRETKGYQVKVEEDIMLNYPPEQDEEVIANHWSKRDQPTQFHWLTTPTDRNMSVLVTTIDEINHLIGSQIAGFNSDGQVIGTGTISSDGMCGLAVWGDDESTDQIDGLQSGEAFNLKLWDAKQDKELVLTPVITLEGEGLIYEPDGLTALEMATEIAVPDVFFLSEAYPNPFNASVRLGYGLTEASDVTIGVYDISGRLVNILTNGKLKAGFHSVVWDGSATASGIYFVRMSAGEFKNVRKVTLVK
jgi:hypothetical protein